MASPFAVFRRNQKILTVVLTCLAMFAFIILDSVSKMDSSSIMPILFGIIGAALAWLWGSQNERGISYSTIAVGAVLGAIAGAVIIAQSANQGGVSTSLGRLSNHELLEMKQKRDMANQFVAGAFRERKENAYAFLMDRYLFGQTSTRDVVIKQLLAHEADQLGIEISDEYITNFIKEVSDNSITRKKLTEIRGQMGLGESELYDLLRSELRAQVAYRVLNPELVHMPDQYWGDFEKLNVRHSIDAVAIPVEPFAAQLARPSDAEINQIFEAFKGVYPSGENPGFIQPDRLKLAWFESDYEAAEKLVGEIPEEELKARYEERKETEYKIETLPDLDSGFDDGGLKFGEPPASTKKTPPAPTKSTPPAGDAEASETPANSGDAKAAPAAKPDGEAPADAPKGDDAKPSDAASPKEKPADADATSQPDPSKECGDDDLEADSSATDSPQDEKKPAAETSAKPEPTATDATAAKDPATKDAAAKEPAAKEAASKDAPIDKAPAETGDAPKEGSEEPATPALSEIKYRAFEEVRDEIRDLMLREKTEARIEKQMTAAIAAVKDWRFNLREASPEISDEDLAAGIAAKAKAYAAANGLKFVNVTDFLSHQELIDHKEYRLGTAREPFDPSNFMNQTQPQTAAARLFTGATTLFVPEEAQGQFDDTRYAFWAAGEKEQHVPTLDEPGVRDQVEKAVRLKNARPKAEARAKSLAEAISSKFAESSIVSMAEGIADQSVLGKSAPAEVIPKTDDTSAPASKSDEGKASDEAENKESCGDEAAADAAPANAANGKPQPVENQPVDAATSDEPLSVISSPPFTWLRQSSQGMQMNPFAQPTVEFGVIPGIDGVDDHFMQTVADAAVGAVVVIPNFTKDVYYVVHVKARNPSGKDDPGLASVRQQFISENAPMSPIYSRLANAQASETHQAWIADFFAKHNVDVAELDAI
ncbi:MAG: hypothetical protein HQ518_32470 [Rhodopirellula sp.]|nr:hypothetical protein [Rhodopirellula sp.]